MPTFVSPHLRRIFCLFVLTSVTEGVDISFDFSHLPRNLLLIFRVSFLLKVHKQQTPMPPSLGGRFMPSDSSPSHIAFALFFPLSLETDLFLTSFFRAETVARSVYVC